MSYHMIRDGHRLEVHLGPDFSFRPVVTCPGHPQCHAQWRVGQKPEDASPCWLAYIAKEVGNEFFEWWTTSMGDSREVKLEGAIEIEWVCEGDDEPETWWAPVNDEETTTEAPECLAAAA